MARKYIRFIVDREILPKTKQGGVDWIKIKEIEVYFTDDEKKYILQVDDVIKENGITKILLSYDNIKYKKYLQSGQVLNGNLETVFNYYGFRGSKLRTYRLSDDGTYWIGVTDKGKEFYFNGEYSEEIMKYNWYISNGYIINVFIKNNKYIGTRLNRMVLGVTDRNIVVNHCGGNVLDNRVESLSISDHKDNMKELLPSKLNNTGITGLSLNKKTNKYNITCTVNGFSYTNTYDTKDDALKDLLIVQRHYKYRHNENLYYMIDDISEEYINKLINKVEANISIKKVYPIICKNKFELSEDGSFYYMYDKDNNRCKISIEDLELVKQGNWHHILNNGKDYFSGAIIYEGKRKGVFLHRFLMDLKEIKYRHWFVDHLDGDGLNNTRENIVITDAQGNGINKNGKGYSLKEEKYMISLILFGKKITKTAYTKEEAIAFVKEKRDEAMKKRIEFYSKEELDKYILKQNIKKIRV